jgi:hypothetical protein
MNTPLNSKKSNICYFFNVENKEVLYDVFVHLDDKNSPFDENSIGICNTDTGKFVKNRGKEKNVYRDIMSYFKQNWNRLIS